MKKIARKAVVNNKDTSPFYITTLFLILASLSTTPFAENDHPLDGNSILQITINDAFDNNVLENPHVLASVDYQQKKTITYKELRDSALRLTNALQKKIGLEKGDLTFTLAENSIHHSVIFHSNMYGGFINANINKILSEDQIIKMINDFECKVLFYHYSFHSFVTKNYMAGRFGNKIKAFIQFGQQSTSTREAGDELDTTLSKSELLAPPLKPSESNEMSAKDESITIDINHQNQPFFDYETLIEEFEPEPIPVKLRKDDLAMLLFTSGTTGIPKAIEISHEVIVDWSIKKLVPLITNLNNFAKKMEADQNTSDDSKRTSTGSMEKAYQLKLQTKFLPGHISHGDYTKNNEVMVYPQYIYMSFSWVVANCFKLMSTFIPLTLIITPEYNREEMLEMTTQFKFTSIFFSPAMVNDLVFSNTKKDVATMKQHVRTFLYGGGPFSETVIEKMIKKYQTPSLRMQQVYASTETLIFGTNLAAEVHNLDNTDYLITVGKPAPGVEIKIVDEELNDVATDKKGKILLKAPVRTSGYYKNPEATKKLFPLGNEWLDTGDYGHLNQEGYLIFNARNNEKIITPQGLNICPKELEDTLMAFTPVVEKALVAGCKSPQVLNNSAQNNDNVMPSICAFIKVDQATVEGMGLDNASLKVIIRERLLDRFQGAQWKVPTIHNILIMKNLPINHNNHKFIKTPLIEAYESGKDLENITAW